MFETREGGGYGWRARIGFLSPSVSGAKIFEFNRMAPRGVVGLETRLNSEKKVDTSTTEGYKEMIDAMVGQVVDEIATLEDAKVDAIVQGGTPFIFTNGAGFGDELMTEINEQTDLPVVLMAHSIRDAIARFDAEKVSLLTYYEPGINDLYIDYLEAFDYEVRGVGGMEGYLRGDIEHMGEVPPIEDAEIPIDATYRAAIDLYNENPETEIMVLSGGNLPCIEIIELLEENLGIPVISSNSASFYYALRAADVNEPLDGWGALLAGETDT